MHWLCPPIFPGLGFGLSSPLTLVTVSGTITTQCCRFDPCTGAAAVGVKQAEDRMAGPGPSKLVT